MERGLHRPAWWANRLAGSRGVNVGAGARLKPKNDWLRMGVRATVLPRLRTLPVANQAHLFSRVGTAIY